MNLKRSHAEIVCLAVHSMNSCSSAVRPLSTSHLHPQRVRSPSPRQEPRCKNHSSMTSSLSVCAAGIPRNLVSSQRREECHLPASFGSRFARAESTSTALQEKYVSTSVQRAQFQEGRACVCFARFTRNALGTMLTMMEASVTTNMKRSDLGLTGHSASASQLLVEPEKLKTSALTPRTPKMLLVSRAARFRELMLPAPARTASNSGWPATKSTTQR
mmetsp:Transcript_67798/g.214472  ORF Transcript_67798/g.214472 Transcript_67798/m.214472 type:complete len:217 (-) Transcript_67798:123-773(-)